MWSKREGPQPGWSFKSLMHQATEKDQPKRHSDHHLPEAKKDSDRTIVCGAEAVCVPAHSGLQGPRDSSSSATSILNPQWGRAARG